MSRLRRPVHALSGVALVVIGAALVASTSAAIDLILTLLCVGLVLLGLIRFMDALSATSWRPAHCGAAVLLVLAGLSLVIWRSASLPLLALTVSIVLLVAGLLRLIAVCSAHSPDSLLRFW